MALLNPVRRAAGAAALALLAGGCDFLYPPTYVPGDPDRVVVHAVLVAGSDSATVMVARVGRGADPYTISGAQVRIIGGGATAVLAEQPGIRGSCARFPPGIAVLPETGCYGGRVPGGVLPGVEYRLEVDVPSGERVRGRTQVPAAPVMYAPQERLRVPFTATEFQMRATQPVAVRWSAPGAASLTALAGRVWAPDTDNVQCSGFVRWEPAETADPAVDSASAMLEVGGCSDPARQAQVRPDSLEMMLSVTVYDSAFTAYYREGDGGIPVERASLGLEDGALGLFGSGARSTRRVILVRQ